jgi:uncharacterized protein YfaS (alpha-2-macroglobulin family)
MLGLGFLLLLALAELVLARPSIKAETFTATYVRGVLNVTIPFTAAQAGSGQLAVEVLDPEDGVLGHTQRHAYAGVGNGHWKVQIGLDKPLAVEDLVWHRLRYRFDYHDFSHEPIEGIESISRILRTPVVHILGQQSYLSSGQAAVRVIVTDTENQVITGGGTVRIELLPPERPAHVLYAGRLNGRGTTEAQFRFPDGLNGKAQLRYVVETSLGETAFTQPVKLEDKISILLSTEKPLYQPGQTIHVRALALDRSRHYAAADRPLTFEVEDARGNKVFKHATQTDKFGVASAEFALADEVNLGTYHLRALMGDAEAGPANTAELALTVEKYVLPKFKVAVDLSGGAARHGYRPGGHVTGTVRANYFFGKPVDDAEVAIKASAMDVSVFDAGSVRGKTDRQGDYRFDLRLPSYFAGRPLSQGAVRVLLEATVKDSAGHAETRGEPITVSESPLLITAVPEGGTLVPNLENQVFLLASYADGAPATADLTVHAAGNPEQHVATDPGGVAVVRIHAGAGKQTLEVEAGDKDGNRATAKLELQARAGEDQILLRTERAVYRPGDPVRLRVFSTVKRGSAYVDIVREGQTILTRDVDLENGQAELALTATPEMAGTLDFNAYVFGRDALPVGDHRLVFVQPADELKIEAVANAPVYQPGGEARIDFHVTNPRGEGVQAALGVQVVDEAVFALAEKQPGFAKVFFYLEQEALKPRYEIHSIGLPGIVEPVEAGQAGQRDLAARALFAATEMVDRNKFETRLGGNLSEAKYREYTARYQERLRKQALRLAEDMSRAFAQDPEIGDVTRWCATIASAADCTDAWGTALKLEPVGQNRSTYLLRSAGPDRQFNTADDLWVYVAVRTPAVAGAATRGKIGLVLEHERGPFNGLAEMVGTVIDATGAVVPAARVVIREVRSGITRETTANNGGEFRLPALPAGDYEVQVLKTGFESAALRLTLSPRDRAVLSATLYVGAATETVEVRAQTVQVETQSAAVGMLVTKRQMENLPINGRNFSDLMELAPGVTFAQRFGRKTEGKEADDSSASAGRVRSYFPEALYINPEIITDGNGRASIAIPLADSITTWRMAMLASTAHGALGSGASSLKVFQDFFVDLDLPVTLTQGDRVSLPVAIYNYSGKRGDVSLQLKPEDWFSLADDAPDKSVAVDPQHVGAAQFTLEAKRIGKFRLTLSARMKGGANRADIVVREIEVIPNGREQNVVFNGRLETSVQHQVDFPAASIADASKIFVRLYPGPLSQVIEGMDSLLRMPYGCFEQTSSSTYPNVLALDYMKRTGKLTPEVHAKAEGFIANGYQRLLTFEVPGGGFSWFGSAPANKILTAYGLMEFYDMSKVHEVDARLIQRTQQWLAGQQQADGSWQPDTSFINEGATNRYNSGVLRITAYLAWSLENTGYQGPAVEKAKQFIERHLDAQPDAYTLAVLANFAADYGKDRDFTQETIQQLLDARTEEGEQAWWKAEETGVYATGTSASVETTGLALQALLKWGGAPATARKALGYIAAKKDASGAWGTTQATIMALRALLLATGKGSSDVRGTAEVLLNGQSAAKLTLTPENNDLLHQFVFNGELAKQSGNRVELRFEGQGTLAYQVVGRYFLPWDKPSADEPLSIAVDYDRTHLAQDDMATATATIKNHLEKTANMVMVDLGIPPGFELLSEDLQSYQEKSRGRSGGRLEKFSQTATQAILYFNSFAAGETVTLTFRLRAKYPIRARTFQSRVYEYYDPDVSSLARPVELEVRGR